MDWIGFDWILLRSLVLLEHLAVLTIGPIKKVSLFGPLGHFHVDVQIKIYFIIFIGWPFIHPSLVTPSSSAMAPHTPTNIPLPTLTPITSMASTSEEELNWKIPFHPFLVFSGAAGTFSVGLKECIQ